MKAKSYVEIHRDKRKAMGLKRVDVWVHPTNEIELKAIAKRLEKPAT